MSDTAILREGDRLIPQPEARVGCYADALHGGPVGAIGHGLQALFIDRANSFGS